MRTAVLVALVAFAGLAYAAQDEYEAYPEGEYPEYPAEGEYPEYPPEGEYPDYGTTEAPEEPEEEYPEEEPEEEYPEEPEEEPEEPEEEPEEPSEEEPEPEEPSAEEPEPESPEEPEESEEEPPPAPKPDEEATTPKSAPSSAAKPLPDNNPNCCQWAKMGECTKNQFFMAPNCQVACGTPGARVWNALIYTPKPSAECSPGATADTTATTPAAAGQTTPAATTPAPGGQPQPQTGGQTAPPKPAPGCTNTNPSCAGWAKNGECAKNPDYMNINCASSCNTCPLPPDPSCDDSAKYTKECKYWAKIGECERNQGFMKTDCKKSCGLCGAAGGQGQMMGGQGGVNMAQTSPAPGAETTPMAGGQTTPAAGGSKPMSLAGLFTPDGEEVQGTIKLNGQDVPFVIRLINGRRRRVALKGLRLRSLRRRF